MYSTINLFGFNDTKSNELAEKYRNTGNVHYKAGEYLEALVAYNKSLSHAVLGSEQVSLAYGNRSAVYLEAKQYQKCLENIELAREHGYPTSKLQIMKEREEKCKKIMQLSHPAPYEDPWEFFKLSHPANEKIPFIVSSLEVRESKKFGRCIFTTSDLKAGDIIAIEEPFYTSARSNQNRCTNCFASNKLSLIPCKRCSKGSVALYSLLIKLLNFNSFSDVLLNRMQSRAQKVRTQCRLRKANSRNGSAPN